MRIPFQTGDGETVWFYVLEQTRFYGMSYLLVTEDADAEETEVYILKDTSREDSEEALYEMVEDEQELNAVAGLFRELVEDAELVGDTEISGNEKVAEEAVDEAVRGPEK